MLRLFICLVLPFLLQSYTYGKQSNTYFCFQTAQANNILLLDSNYSTHARLMYFPYMKPIQVRFMGNESVELTEGRPLEFHDFYHEINKGKLSGKYEIIHQGAQFYSIRYTHFQTGKITDFSRLYASSDLPQNMTQHLLEKGITCL